MDVFQQRRLALAVLTATLGLSACNSNNHDTPTTSGTAATSTTFTVTPSLGKIVNAKVVLRNANSLAILTEKPLDNGSATFTLPNSQLTTPILAEVLPNATGNVQYFDEATNNTETITIGSTARNTPLLRAVAPLINAGMQLGITALTEAAVQNAETLSGGAGKGLNITAINTANQSVQQAFGLTHSILQAPTLIGSLDDYAKLVQSSLDQASRDYATRLAGLAKLGQTGNSSAVLPALEMAQALAKDLSDGQLDGNVANGVTAPAVLPYDQSNFALLWQQAATAVVNDLKSRNLSFASQLESYQQALQFAANNQSSSGLATAAIKPLRTVDGIEEYACDSWGKVPNGGQEKPVNVKVVNQLPNSTDNISVFGLSSILRTVTYFSGIPGNGGFRARDGMHRQMVRIDGANGQCKGVFRAVTEGSKVLTVTSTGVTIGSVVPEPAAVTCASLNLNKVNAASISGFVGTYDVDIFGTTNNKLRSTTMSLAANGDLTLETVTAHAVEICGPTNLPSGVSYSIVTDAKEAGSNTTATIVAFKDNNDRRTLEGTNFISTAGVYSGVLQPANSGGGTTTPANCSGTHEFGCLTITSVNGISAPKTIFSHSREQNFFNNGAPVEALASDKSGTVTFRHPQVGSFTEDSILAVGFGIPTAYSYQEFDANLKPINQHAYNCAATSGNPAVCVGMLHRPATREILFDDVLLTEPVSNSTIRLNGTLKY